MPDQADAASADPHDGRRDSAARGDIDDHAATVSESDRQRAVKIVTRAAEDLREGGFRVSTIRHGRPGQPVMVSYQDPHGHGIPASLLAELAPLPEGTVEFLRNGPTAVAIAHGFRR